MNRLLFVFLLFGSVGFFNYHGLMSPVVMKSIIYFGVLASFIMGVTERDSSLRDVYYPRSLYFTVLGGILFSCVICPIFNPQSFSITLKTTLNVFVPYAYFYCLMRQRVAPSFIIKSLMVFSLCSVIVYFCNLYTFPNNIFGTDIKDDLSRGIIRITVVGLMMMMIVLFYAINRWNTDHKPLWWIVIIAGMVMVIMSVIRQVIVLVTVLALVMLIKRYSWSTRIVAMVVVTAVAALVVPRLPMYKSMMELSKLQADQNSIQKEDIRITAWRFYTYEQWDNLPEMLFGHGMPSTSGDSVYGNRFEAETDTNKCFAIDVGWAGFSFFFGVIATLALMALVVKTIIHCSRYRSKEYLAYWFTFIGLTSFASGPVLWDSEILAIVIGLYLAYCPEDNIHEDSEHYIGDIPEDDMLLNA